MADKCHAMIVPDEGEVIRFSSDSLEEFKKELYKRLLAARCGNVQVVVNGDVWAVSQPQQLFHLKPPTGDAQKLGPYESAVYDEGGRYAILREADSG